MTVAESQDISLDIACPFDRANDFLAVPENFAKWASGLGESLRRSGEGWAVQTPEGAMRVAFTPKNEFGVLDHRLTPEAGNPIDVPLRVIPNGEGCHVMLTLFRLPGMTDERFAADAEWVRQDLGRLKVVLEGLAASDASGEARDGEYAN